MTLRNVDASEHPEIAELVAARFAAWKRDADEYPLFGEFIEPERNAILKEYEFGVGAEQVVGTWENLQTGERGEMPIPTKIYAYEEGPFAGEDVRDVARKAIEFLRGELDEHGNRDCETAFLDIGTRLSDDALRYNMAWTAHESRRLSTYTRGDRRQERTS